MPIFRKALNDSIAPVLKHAEQYGLDGLDPQLLINRNVWASAYQTAYSVVGIKSAKQEYYRQRRLEGVTKSSAIDFLIDIWSGTLRDYAMNYVNSIQSDLNQTTIDLIRAALNGTHQLGLDRYGRVRLFTDTIKEKFGLRSLTISRTETTTLANIGKDIGARSWISEQGGGGYKVWLGRIIGERPEHVAENDTIIEIDDLYPMAGFPCMRPGDVTLPPHLRINCKCTQSLMSQNRYNQYIKRGRIVNGKLTGAS